MMEIFFFQEESYEKRNDFNNTHTHTLDSIYYIIYYVLYVLSMYASVGDLRELCEFE